MDRDKVARELLRLAKELAAEESGIIEDEVDPRFAEKVRELRQSLPSIGRKKSRKLRQYGIGLIRPNDSVESLIDALLSVSKAG